MSFRLVILNKRISTHSKVFVANFPLNIVSTLNQYNQFWDVKRDWHGKHLDVALQNMTRSMTSIDVLEEEVEENMDNLLYFCNWLHNLKTEILLKEYHENSLCLFLYPRGLFEQKVNHRRTQNKAICFINFGTTLQQLKDDNSNEQKTEELEAMKRQCFEVCVDSKRVEPLISDAYCHNGNVKTDLLHKHVSNKDSVGKCEFFIDYLISQILWTNELFVVDECDAFLTYGIMLYWFPDFESHDIFHQMKMTCFDWTKTHS